MDHLTEAGVDLVVCVPGLKETELHCPESAGAYQMAGPQEQELISRLSAGVVCLDNEGWWCRQISFSQNCRGLVHCMASSKLWNECPT